MLDDAQELPEATLLLLSKVVEQGFFVTYDQAQKYTKDTQLNVDTLESFFTNQQIFDVPKSLPTPPTLRRLNVKRF